MANGYCGLSKDAPSIINPVPSAISHQPLTGVSRAYADFFVRREDDFFFAGGGDAFFFALGVFDEALAVLGAGVLPCATAGVASPAASSAAAPVPYSRR